ncbi:hypothetical protein HK101_001273, partial [Irineochytrium annulatum]
MEFLLIYFAYLAVVTVGAKWFGKDHKELATTASDGVPHPDDEEDDDVPTFTDDPTETTSFRVLDRPTRPTDRRPLLASFFDRVLPKEQTLDGDLQDESGTPVGGLRAASSRRNYGSITDAGPEIRTQLARGQSRSLWSAFAINEAALRAGAGVSAITSDRGHHHLHATVLEWLFPTLLRGTWNASDPGAWDRRGTLERFGSVMIAP